MNFHQNFAGRLSHRCTMVVRRFRIAKTRHHERFFIAERRPFHRDPAISVWV
jgi:hypothetical protein